MYNCVLRCISPISWLQNFCNDVYVGCCDFDRECDLDCVGILVAGCVQPPFPTASPSVNPTNSPSVSFAPSISDSPTPAPTVSNAPSLSESPTSAPRPTAVPVPPTEPEPQCTIAVNLGLCPELIANQEVVPGCNCYVSVNTETFSPGHGEAQTYPTGSLVYSYN